MVVRALAVERGVRAIVLFVAAYAINRFKAEQGALQRLFDNDLPAFRELGTRLHVDVDSSVVVRLMRHLLTIRPSTLTFVAVAALLYGLIEAVEAVGLWLLSRWGEYFTVVATAVFIPFEVDEILTRFTVTKAIALALNIGAVIYLVIAKRLFGVRGGGRVYHRERRAESLIEMEVAASIGGVGTTARTT